MCRNLFFPFLRCLKLIHVVRENVSNNISKWVVSTLWAFTGERTRHQRPFIWKQAHPMHEKEKMWRKKLKWNEMKYGNVCNMSWIVCVCVCVRVRWKFLVRKRERAHGMSWNMEWADRMSKFYWCGKKRGAKRNREKWTTVQNDSIVNRSNEWNTA